MAFGDITGNSGAVIESDRNRNRDRDRLLRNLAYQALTTRLRELSSQLRYMHRFNPRRVILTLQKNQNSIASSSLPPFSLSGYTGIKGNPALLKRTANDLAGEKMSEQ
jgi:hypothetical protein